MGVSRSPQQAGQLTGCRAGLGPGGGEKSQEPPCMALCSQALRREHPAIWALEPEQAGGGEVGRKGSEETWGGPGDRDTGGETERRRETEV